MALYMGAYLAGVGVLAAVLSGGWYQVSWAAADELGELSMLRGDIGGVSSIYAEGGGMLLISA